MAADLILYGAVSGCIKYLLHYMSGKKRPSSAKLVGRVKAVNLYPFKSMAGVSLQECPCTFAGLELDGIRDRQWMIVTARNHTFVSARAQPKLVTIATSIHDDGIHLDVSGMPTLALKKNLQMKDATVLDSQVWGQNISGIDAGDEAAAWIEKFFNKPAGTYRVLYHSDRLPKRVLVKQDDPWMEQCKPQDAVQYQDGFPYLLISSASVDALSRSVEEKSGQKEQLSIKRFRTNIEVEGCGAYAEDSWKDVYIGDTKFTNMKPCGRCTMTTVDAETGTKHPDKQPLKTMEQVRPVQDGAPSFGVNLVVDWPGVIAVGQSVYATQQ